MSLNDLQKVTSKTVKRFTLDGTRTMAKVISIQSGNSCDLVFQFGGQLLSLSCRLMGVDAPKIDEKPKAGKLARDYLARMCMEDNPIEFDETSTWNNKDLQWLLDDNNHLIHAKFERFDPSGILLVTLRNSPRGKSFNDRMKAYVQELQNVSESSDASESISED